MFDKKCINCVEYKRCRDSFVSWIFFSIGLIATFSLRVVTVLINIDPIYGKIAWYIGVGGFFIFFLYKFRVNQERSRLITERNLVRKISGLEKLDRKDYELVEAILCALSSNKDRINYFFIFILSAVAIVVALYFDIFR